MKFSKIKTKRAVIDVALKEFIANHKTPDTRAGLLRSKGLSG